MSQKMIKFQETLPVVFASLLIACSALRSKALDGYISCTCTDNLSQNTVTTNFSKLLMSSFFSSCFLGSLDESYVDYASCLDTVPETVESFLAYHL